MDPRPNILFICVDQWRADCLGFTGHPTVETPHLDRLARDSTHFSQAYSATPTCVPARAALLTGLAPRQQDADYIDTGIGCNGYVARPWVYDEMLHPTSWVTTQGIDFFRRRDPRKPFFLMLSYHRPHPPLDPPVAYLERYLNKDLPETLCGDWVDFGLPPGGHDSPVPHDQAQIDYARRAYYAQLTHIDHQINRVIMGLFENGLLDNTAIVFTADHGEMLYDHHQIAKGVPFDSSARLPFLLRLPIWFHLSSWIVLSIQHFSLFPEWRYFV